MIWVRVSLHFPAIFGRARLSTCKLFFVIQFNCVYCCKRLKLFFWSNKLKSFSSVDCSQRLDTLRSDVAFYSGREAPSSGFGSVLRLCAANNCACVIMQDQFDPRSEFCSPKARWRWDKILHNLSIVPYQS